MNMKGRYWLNFDAKRATQPLIWEMSKKFNVVFNIRQASVSEEVAVMAIEIDGDREEIKSAILWFEEQGVTVEPVEINTIEG